MMGYASVTQTTNSLWQRQWARAFVLSSAPPGTGARLRPDTTVAVVVVDACMVFPDLKAAALREVSAILAARAVADASRESSPYDAENLAGSFDALVQDDLVSVDASPFDETNVCVCATHTHAAPGGTRRTRCTTSRSGGASETRFARNSTVSSTRSSPRTTTPRRATRRRE